MANSEDTYRRTKRTEAVLNLYRAFKKFQELLQSDVDHHTAFLQAFLGIYQAAPQIPRPDYILTTSDLYNEIKAAHAYASQLNQETEEAAAYMETFMKAHPPK